MAWYAANVFKLVTARPGSSDVSRFTMTVHDPHNLTIEVDNPGQKGTIKLVEGRAMLTRGLALGPGSEIDALDGPVLNFQLVISLLARAVPAGPDKMTGTQEITLDEKERPLQVATKSASIEVSPPWSLSGSLSRTDEETIDFKLRLSYERDKTPFETSYEGSWQHLKQAPGQDYAMALSGWNFYSLGVRVTALDGKTGAHSTAPPPAPVATLGELRDAIRAGKPITPPR